MSKRILANLVVFLTVFLVMCVWAVRNVVTVDAIEKPYDITVELQATSGLAAGAEVAYLGVNYGRIGSVELVEGGVEATLLIDNDRRIPEGSIARVFRKSAIGEPYIDFQPPGDFDHEGAGDDDYIQEGEVVPVEDTRTPIEFSELLRTASNVISSIDPERAATLLHELALALDGRGEDLRALTENGDRLAATFAERTDVLDRLAVNNTRLTAVFAEHRGALGQSLSDLAALAESLRAASGDTRILLDRGAALLAEAGDLVHDIRPDLDCLLDDLVAVNERGSQPAQLEGLARHLEIGPAAYGLFYGTRDVEPDGPWVRVNLLLAPENASPQHVPPLDLPAVPGVVPCQDVAGAAAGGPVVADDVRLASLRDDPSGQRAPAVALAVVLAAAALGVASVRIVRRRG
jgi:phospholipid/cholesterol/gamma-HCH transport system substrate-binding protein